MTVITIIWSYSIETFKVVPIFSQYDLTIAKPSLYLTSDVLDEFFCHKGSKNRNKFCSEPAVLCKSG